jgi:hypothetical protein
MSMSTEEIIAGMFAEAALRRVRLSCECESPTPGVWNALGWTTCQKCQRQLSRLHYVYGPHCKEQA